TSVVRTGTKLQKSSEQEINFSERNTEELFSFSLEKLNVLKTKQSILFIIAHLDDQGAIPAN
ncbi:hypothetical protein Avbf_18086, partial [Armadillidium vulgare]